MYTATHLAERVVPLLTVQAPEDIEFLVKESEVLTARAGRTFVIASADWLAYRGHWQPIGLKVERLDPTGWVLSVRHLLPKEFRRHSLMEALATGQLLPPPVRRLG